MKEFFELPRIHIECDCGNELLQLVFDEDEEEDFKFLYISFYNNHCGNLKVSWKYRLQHIWYIIKHGVPWADQITLNKHERLKLTEYLNNLDKK